MHTYQILVDLLPPGVLRSSFASFPGSSMLATISTIPPLLDPTSRMRKEEFWCLERRPAAKTTATAIMRKSSNSVQPAIRIIIVIIQMLITVQNFHKALMHL